MTAHHIHTNAHPMRSAMPILPMTDEQRRFWRLRRERAQQKDRRP